MARRIVTEEEARSADGRSFSSIRILRDGRVRFGDATQGSQALEFRVNRYHRDSGRWFYDSSNYSISARQAGSLVFLIYLARSRVISTCFEVNLSASGLRQAVEALRAFGNGLERWLAPGLDATQRIVSGGMAGNPELLKVIPRLQASLRSPGRAGSARAAGR